VIRTLQDDTGKGILSTVVLHHIQENQSKKLKQSSNSLIMVQATVYAIFIYLFIMNDRTIRTLCKKEVKINILGYCSIDFPTWISPNQKRVTQTFFRRENS